MARGVKRKRKDRNDSDILQSPSFTPVRRHLLQMKYPQVQTLRQYFLSSLPGSSRLRRKKITSLGLDNACSEPEAKIARFLESTLVCSSQDPQISFGGDAFEEFLTLSQRADDSSGSLAKGLTTSAEVQCDIVDFVIWLLFKRHKTVASLPSNLLCDGFSKTLRQSAANDPKIPGIYCFHSNPRVAVLKQAPWPHLLALLGHSSQALMADLLMSCSIFIAVESGVGNYYQLTGSPLFAKNPSTCRQSPGLDSPATKNRLSNIVLARSRIFYTQPALNALGRIEHGLHRMHVLNRCCHPRQSPQARADSSRARVNAVKKNEVNTLKFMMHMFPRQFRLHNIFISNCDRAGVAHQYPDYVIQEKEIAASFNQGKASGRARLPKLPTRLRGVTEHLVKRLQVLHSRCSYGKLLSYYCPTHLDNTLEPTARRQAACEGYIKPLRTSALSKPTSLVELACPTSRVSVFCQAVLSKIIPDQFWGQGDVLNHNKAAIMRKVDHFIKLRRFESMSLHEIIQGLKITNLPWLQPPSLNNRKPCRSETDKQWELFHEFLYYVFDSLLIPLIRSNFYVTESNAHRNEIFYFRHKIWRLVAGPALAEIKSSMLEELESDEALQILHLRQLGFGQIRLVPKENKFRLIMNLQRRNRKHDSRAWKRSVNSALAPVHTVLKFEKATHPSRLGSSIWSVGDIYERLKEFKGALGSGKPHLYFAKVDVKAAFDTIPQEAIIQLGTRLFSEERYMIRKHAEVQSVQCSMLGLTSPSNAITKWHLTALGSGQDEPLLKRLENKTSGLTGNTVFVESVARNIYEKDSLKGLLTELIEQNMVKIGKKFFRQKRGIPQGSVLSSQLCSYFYADLERTHLSFLGTADCLLLRLIDDFLLITLDKSKAVRFVEILHRGLADYGVEANAQKTLVNFDMRIGGQAISKVPGDSRFPYCGIVIDCQSLDVIKDKTKGDEMAISNSLTINFGRSPGVNFQRRTLNYFKMQSHLILYDTSHNSNASVFESLNGAFGEICRKMLAYIHCLSRRQRPSARLVIQTISKLADVAFFILSGKIRKMKHPGYAFDITKEQVSAIAYMAFLSHLRRKQTGYMQVISWLQKSQSELRRWR